MRIRFNWADDMVPLYNSIFGQAYLPTAAIGSILTPMLMAKSKRISILLPSIVAIFGISIHLIENMWAMLLGRVIIGFSNGIMVASTG